jgi:hypothetical protein
MVIDSSENFRMPLAQRAGTVRETAEVTATVTIKFDEDWENIISVFNLGVENQFIGITARPPIADDYDETDQAEDGTGPEE